MNVYRFLCAAWWPHPVHDSLRVSQDAHTLVFTCSCGEKLGLPLEAAADLALL